MAEVSSSVRQNVDEPALPSTELHRPEHWFQLAQTFTAEDEDDDSSTIGDASTDSTASMASSILRYRTINGRTFHSERGNAQYWASNDDKNNETLDIGHHFQTLLRDGKLFFSPLKKDIQRAVDIGTGTGIWAIDFADEFHNTEVIGTDVSPIQPSWVPQNLKFEIEDCTQTWTFEPDSIDFVHMRYLFGSISDWSALCEEAFRVCKPGGWVESCECTTMIDSDDGSVTDDSALREWGRLFMEGGKRTGRSFTVLEDGTQEKCMRGAGFVDIQVKDLKVPVGSWPRDEKLKEVGQYVQLALEKDLEGYVLYLASQFLGWTKEEISAYCAQFRREMCSGKYHAFYRQRIVWGRKPKTS